MICERTPLWPDADHPYYTTYLQEPSLEIKAAKRPCVIVCPGGAYLGTSDREAEPVALRFASLGYQVIVLRYTTWWSSFQSDWKNPPPGNPRSKHPQHMIDLAKTIRIVRENAEKWSIDPDKVAICGFSAGGHLCATMAVRWDDPVITKTLGGESRMYRPDAAILGYPVTDYLLMRDKQDVSDAPEVKGLWKMANLALFGEEEPSLEDLKELSPAWQVKESASPVFLWHTAADGLVHVENSIRMAAALSAKKVPFEMHVFEEGPHGLSLADETTAAEPAHVNPEASVWFDMAVAWLKKRFDVSGKV